MTTEKKEAENLWELYIDRKAGYVNPMQSARETLSDYKEALRAELESLADPQNYNGAHDFDDGMIHAYKQVIELLDTVTPKEK